MVANTCAGTTRTDPYPPSRSPEGKQGKHMNVTRGGRFKVSYDKRKDGAQNLRWIQMRLGKEGKKN